MTRHGHLAALAALLLFAGGCSTEVDGGEEEEELDELEAVGIGPNLLFNKGFEYKDVLKRCRSSYPEDCFGLKEWAVNGSKTVLSEGAAYLGDRGLRMQIACGPTDRLGFRDCGSSYAIQDVDAAPGLYRLRLFLRPHYMSVDELRGNLTVGVMFVDGSGVIDYLDDIALDGVVEELPGSEGRYDDGWVKLWRNVRLPKGRTGAQILINFEPYDDDHDEDDDAYLHVDTVLFARLSN